jgi:glycosyltransferase involved in cell wall biosynthesis
MPLISIITINYNNLSGLQKTLESVCNQSFVDYEYLIIDGGSTDGSKEFIETKRNNINYWISEKDNGVYDAMNKGILRANGKYLLFLNSGDYFFDSDTLSKLFSYVFDEDIVYGDVVWEKFDESGDQMHQCYPKKISFDYFTKNSLPHQSSLIKKILFETIDLYDVSCRISADWAFFILAIYKYNCSYLHINVPISICGRNGISCLPENQHQISLERESILNKHFSSFIAELSDYHLLKIEYSKLTDDYIKLKRQLTLAKNSFGYRLQLMLKNILGYRK